MPRGKDVAKRVDENLLKIRAKLKDDGAEPQSCEFILKACGRNLSIQKACEMAGLDPANPQALAAVLVALAAARFERKDPPKKWDSFSWSQLLMNFLRERLKNKDVTDAAICGELIKNVKLYKSYTRRRLLRIFQDASDPAQNLLLRDVLAMMPLAVEAANEHRRHGAFPEWQKLEDNYEKLHKRTRS